jgi:hypothetical protein
VLVTLTVAGPPATTSSSSLTVTSELVWPTLNWIWSGESWMHGRLMAWPMTRMSSNRTV